MKIGTTVLRRDGIRGPKRTVEGSTRGERMQELKLVRGNTEGSGGS